MLLPSAPELVRTDSFPPCAAVLPFLSASTFQTWFADLQTERFAQKAYAIRQRLAHADQRWEDAFFITLARNFGFGRAGDRFEAWAARLPFRAIDKHRDSLFQIEAFFFGTAGLLEGRPAGAGDYYYQLRKEFHYLQRKFELREVTDAPWDAAQLRAGGYPHVRLAQLAHLYYKEQALFSRAMEAESLEEVKALFVVTTSPYWETHTIFGKPSPKIGKSLGGNALNLLVINTVVPFLYAYALYKGSEALCERATRFLESLPAENNHIIRLWRAATPLPITSAAHSQAVLQLQKAYCDPRNCLACRFGTEYLRLQEEHPA
ncbi:MAG: DUF2851 family protein [Prevotellaceae bacterium]|jgi:hypothetical protein|nr:DUF2851 family protein [Prevotellaceae bacterium]